MPDDYPGLLAEVRERIRTAQYAALRAVNKELVGLYWDIGQMIVQRQEAEGWGKSVGRLADEGVFRNVSRLGKTRTNGARNWGFVKSATGGCLNPVMFLQVLCSCRSSRVSGIFLE